MNSTCTRPRSGLGLNELLGGKPRAIGNALITTVGHVVHEDTFTCVLYAELKRCGGPLVCAFNPDISAVWFEVPDILVRMGMRVRYELGQRFRSLRIDAHSLKVPRLLVYRECIHPWAHNALLVSDG